MQIFDGTLFNFSLRLHRIPREFNEFSGSNNSLSISGFSRFVATLLLPHCDYSETVNISLQSQSSSGHALVCEIPGSNLTIDSCFYHDGQCDF